MEEETHLEYMLKNTESKTLKTRYLDAKVLILTDTLSRIQERIDKDAESLLKESSQFGVWQCFHC